MDCYFAPGHVGRNDWKGDYMDGSGIESQGKVAYEAPRVERLGFFHEETSSASSGVGTILLRASSASPSATVQPERQAVSRH